RCRRLQCNRGLARASWAQSAAREFRIAGISRPQLPRHWCRRQRMSIDFNRLRVDLREDAEHVVTTLLGKPTKRSRGEFRYGTTGYALAVMIRGAKAGAWYDHETGDGGDLLALIAREHRCDFRQAVEIAEKLLQRSYTEAPRPARRVEACSNGDTDHRRL